MPGLRVDGVPMLRIDPGVLTSSQTDGQCIYLEEN